MKRYRVYSKMLRNRSILVYLSLVDKVRNFSVLAINFANRIGLL